MAKIRFENGITVNFDGNPTPQDVEEVAVKLKLKPQNTGLPIVKTGQKIADTFGNMNLGVLKGVGRTATDIAKLGVKALPSALYGGEQGKQQTLQAAENLKEGVFKSQNMAQKIGGGLETAAELFSPTGIVSKGKAVMGGLKIAKDIGKIPVIGKTAGYLTQKVLNALPEAGLGYAYEGVKTGDKEEAKKGALLFGALSGTGEVVGDIFKAVKGTLNENVIRALGYRGKIAVSGVQDKVNKGVNTFRTMFKLSDDIKVKDVNGVEKAWEPSKDGFYEAAQAFDQTKKKIYQAYTELATQAGDEGAKFIQRDFDQLVTALKSQMKDTTSSYRNKAVQLLGDLYKNFATLNRMDGKFYFKDVDLPRMQGFLEKLNKDVNPMSDKAAAQVSIELSQKLREIMDGKIMNATGKEYQKLRTAYADAKAIENDLVAQLKRAMNQTGGYFAKWGEGIGAIETVLGIISANPVQAARGTGIAILGGIKKYLGNKENNLRNIFKSFQSDVKEKSPITERLFGTDKQTQLPESLRNAQPGLTIKAIKPPKINKNGNYISPAEYDRQRNYGFMWQDRLKKAAERASKK